jgi:hypothetical protein
MDSSVAMAYKPRSNTSMCPASDPMLPSVSLNSQLVLSPSYGVFHSFFQVEKSWKILSLRELLKNKLAQCTKLAIFTAKADRQSWTGLREVDFRDQGIEEFVVRDGAFERCLKQIQWQHPSHVRHLRDVELAHREIEACFGFVVVVVALQTCSPYLFGKCQDRILTN